MAKDATEVAAQETAPEAPPVEVAPVAPACPVCGGPVEVYEGDNPFKVGTVFCPVDGRQAV